MPHSHSLASRASKQSISNSTQQGKQAHSGKPATDRGERGSSKQQSRYLATVGEGEGRIRRGSRDFGRRRRGRLQEAAAVVLQIERWATEQRGVMVLFGVGASSRVPDVSPPSAPGIGINFIFFNQKNRVREGYVYRTRIGRIGVSATFCTQTRRLLPYRCFVDWDNYK
jgi:hypothetical protein